MERKSMKSIKANALKLMVVIALLCPAAFADGDMGSGGLAEYDVPTASVKTSRSLDGDMGSGGRTSSSSYLDSVLNSIYDYFDSMI